MPIALDTALPSITDVGLLACLSIAYGKTSRLVKQRNTRAIIMGLLFGLMSTVSSLYHQTEEMALLADHGAIYIGFAAAFLGPAGALTALVFAFFAGLALGTSAPLEPLILIFACLAGTLWAALTRGWERRTISALLALGVLINAALLPAYIWPQQALAIPLPLAVVTSFSVILGIAVLFGSFIDRERSMLDAELHLQQLANTDQLTGLHNRRTLISAFDSRALKPGGQALLLIDVDNFKSVNDAHGHSAGDEVLRHIARHLQGSVRAGDILCRFGGEEFAVLLNADTEDAAMIAAERLRSDIQDNRVRIGQLALQVTVSVGLAFWHGSTSFEEQFGRADSVLYQAKRDGRNCVRVATDATAESKAAAQ